MRILGVDPGTHQLGFGVLDSTGSTLHCLSWGHISAERNAPIHERLYQLHQELRQVVEHWQPQHLAVEEPFVAPTRGAKSAVAVGQAQAIAFLLAAETGMQVHRYAPSQVKQAVGDYGASTKSQVQRMVQMVLGMEQKPISEDASDALAIALCHLHHWQAGQQVRQV
jgi:crossover junction endodeoxyribonuclease RuvC